MAPEKPRSKSLRDGANRVAAVLREAGYEAYLAGGCVRDTLLGVEPKDYDIATDATPSEVTALFRRTVQVGAAFGVVRVLISRGFEYEVATYRRDLSYSDGRRPDAVQYSKSKKEDVERRDFTINALLMDPETEEVLDYVGGREDLAASKIRCVGDPAMRFEEDRLRMLRAVRFAARFGFAIEDATMAAVKAHAGEIKDVSAERILIELNGIWSSPRPQIGLRLLEQSKLLAQVLPFVTSENLEDLEAQMVRLASDTTLDRKRKQAVAFALLLDEMGPKRALPELRRMKLSREETRWVLHMLNVRSSFRTPARPADTVRLAVDPEREAILVHEKCALGEDSTEVERFKQVVDDLARRPLPELPLLTGDDLKSLGFAPGPKFKEILAVVEAEIFERKIQTRDDAIRWVDERYSA